MTTALFFLAAFGAIVKLLDRINVLEAEVRAARRGIPAEVWDAAA